MDRLSALVIGLALVACDKHDDASAPASRTDVAKVAQKQVSTEAFCDKHWKDDSGPEFHAPALIGAEAIHPTTKWRWVNVWATWCHPCTEEIPRLVKWQPKLPNVDLAFVSLDDNDKDVAEFRSEHPDMPASARIQNEKDQGPWLIAMGLDSAAAVPVHVFVSPKGHVRCARSGSVRDTDFAAVEALLKE